MALQDVSVFVDLHRLPELFCGLDRRPGEGPTLYPVACAPQAWAAGAIYMLVEAVAGISVSAIQKEVVLDRPFLPEGIQTLQITNLMVGPAEIDLGLSRSRNGVDVEVLRKSGEVNLVVSDTPMQERVPAAAR
jgi:hypothetical protein